MMWNIIGVNVLCVEISTKEIGWYLLVIGKIHYEETLVYLFTGEVTTGTPKFLNGTSI